MREPLPRYLIHGHAIVSADDRIADAEGKAPPVLHNAADWERFQAALDAAAVVILGRRGHERHPNPHGRNRLVLSSSANGIERREDAWWWNPTHANMDEAFAKAMPGGGVAAVVGGQRVFDYFLAPGYDRFELSRIATVTLPGGVAIFSPVATGFRAEDVLRAVGLRPSTSELIDTEAQVTLTVWLPG